MSKTITCPDCGGSGWTENSSETTVGCTRCGGSNREVKTLLGGYKWERTKGTGRITVSGAPCSTCNGKGKYQTEVNSYPEYRQGGTVKWVTCYACKGSGFAS